MIKVKIVVVLLICMAVLSCTTSSDNKNYPINPTMDPNTPGKIYIPKNLEDAHQELKKMLHEEFIEEIKVGKEDNLAQHHFGLGTWIRNNWELWGGSRLAEYFVNIGIYHPDDMSGIIIESFWYDVNGKTYPLKERISEFQEYWKSMETPEEGSPIDGAKITWLITQHTKDHSPKGTVHLGLSISDKTGWRYEYGSGRGIEPATTEEDIQLDSYRDEDLNNF
ncbi:MAG: hypothetical protein GY774_21125 [Planctomycetes bacterium]|nr:hypothetical protein [Planctomycetota bacterium]